MKIFGLTGPTGAGKGLVSELFASKYAIPSIDTDQVYHALLIPPSACLNELVRAFGTTILTSEGRLNRPALSQIVFSDASGNQQKRLNRITHKYVLDHTREILACYRCDGMRAVLVDAPLLYESGFDTECDAVIAVLAPMELRKTRICARDGLSEERAIARLNMQKPDAFYLEKTDHIIVNDGDRIALAKQIEALAMRLGVVKP